MSNPKDQDREKGAVEQDERTQTGNTSMKGQLGIGIKIRCSKPPTPTSPSPAKIPNTPAKSK